MIDTDVLLSLEYAYTHTLVVTILSYYENEKII